MITLILIIILIIQWIFLLAKDRELKLMIQITNNTAETSNQQLEIIDKLEMIRINSLNIKKNTYFYKK